MTTPRPIIITPRHVLPSIEGYAHDPFAETSACHYPPRVFTSGPRRLRACDVCDAEECKSCAIPRAIASRGKGGLAHA